MSLERESRFFELTLNVLRPASRFSLSLWCIYNDLRITSAVTIDSIETPAESESPAGMDMRVVGAEIPAEMGMRTVESETPAEIDAKTAESEIPTEIGTRTAVPGRDPITAVPLAFCCLLRESEDLNRLDLRGDFAAVCVDSARREVVVKTAKKNLAVPCARICDVFFVDQREHKGLAICVPCQIARQTKHLTEMGRRSLLLFAPCDPSFSRETLFQTLNPLLPFPYVGSPRDCQLDGKSRGSPRREGFAVAPAENRGLRARLRGRAGQFPEHAVGIPAGIEAQRRAATIRNGDFPVSLRFVPDPRGSVLVSVRAASAVSGPAVAAVAPAGLRGFPDFPDCVLRFPPVPRANPDRLPIHVPRQRHVAAFLRRTAFLKFSLPFSPTATPRETPITSSRFSFSPFSRPSPRLTRPAVLPCSGTSR